MKALIVAAGDMPKSEIFFYYYNLCDIKISADNGLHTFYEYNSIPDIIIGDFDSSNNLELDYFIEKGCLYIPLEKEKNMTDSEAAIDVARKNNADEIVLLGATGKRIDHLIANLMLLRGAYEANIKLKIEDNDNEIYVDGGEFIIEGFKNQTISLFPTDTCANVTALSGVYYPLDKLKLTNTHSRGISNIMVEDKAVIKTDQPLLIIKNKNKV